MKLTESEKQAINKGEAIRAVDDGVEIVIIRADVYDRFRVSLTPEVVTKLVDETMNEYDADDPLLDSYQKSEA